MPVGAGDLPEGRARFLTFAMADRTLVSVAEDKTVRSWNVLDGTQLHKWSGVDFPHLAASLSKDRLLIVKDELISLLDLKAGTELSHRRIGPPLSRTLTLGPRARQHAWWSEENGLQVEDVTSGETRQLLKPDAMSIRTVVGMCFSCDGKVIAVIAADDSDENGRTLTLFDAQSGGLLHKLRNVSQYGGQIAFSPDSALVAASDRDDRIHLWFTKNGDRRGTFVDIGHGTSSLAFSPDGKVLAAGSKDGQIRFLDVQNGDLLYRRVSASGEVTALAFSANGQLLASAHADTSVLIWKMQRD
jgi:WD40 repeat protein